MLFTVAQESSTLYREYLTPETNNNVEPFFIGAIFKTESSTILPAYEPNDESQNPIYAIKTDKDDWSVFFETNGMQVEYKIDTGAQVNVLLFTIYKKLYNRPKKIIQCKDNRV